MRGRPGTRHPDAARPGRGVVRWAVPASAARRIGVLTALEGGDGGAVAVGDPAAHHVRLRPDGLRSVFGSGAAGASAPVPWDRVRAVAVDLPTTWWPHPAIGDTVLPVIEGILGGSSGGITETPTFPVRVTVDDGSLIEWRATPHYLSGYRRRDVVLASRFLEHLVARSDARVLLARPDDLLARLGEILRRT